MNCEWNEGKKKVNKVFWLMYLIVFLSQSELSFGGSNSNRSEKEPALFGSPAGFNRSSLVYSQDTIVHVSNPKSPSKLKAFLLSFILPGVGEYYAGSKRLTKIFLSSEIILWTAYFSFRTYGNWKKDDYIQLAVSHAGVNASGKDHQYFVNIENFDHIRAYNEVKLRQRQFDELYPENGYYSWQWDSETSRLTFERLRIASDTAYHRSLFVIGGILVNHIISGIDALRLAKKSRQESENPLRIGVAGLPEGGMMVLFWKPF